MTGHAKLVGDDAWANGMHELSWGFLGPGQNKLQHSVIELIPAQQVQETFALLTTGEIMIRRLRLAIFEIGRHFLVPGLVFGVGTEQRGRADS